MQCVTITFGHKQGEQVDDMVNARKVQMSNNLTEKINE